MANENIYSVTLPNGETVERRSPRPYTHAIVTIVTEAYRTRRLAELDTKIIAARAEVERLSPAAAAPGAREAYEAAKSRRDYLDEQVQDGDRMIQRWLSDAFKTEASGLPKPAGVPEYGGAWDGSGFKAVTACNAIYYATAIVQLEGAKDALECAIKQRAHYDQVYTVGNVLEVNWSQSAKNAAACANKHNSGYHAGCEVLVIDDIKVHVPKRRAKKGE